jgi:hypothetical protein
MKVKDRWEDDVGGGGGGGGGDSNHSKAVEVTGNCRN